MNTHAFSSGCRWQSFIFPLWEFCTNPYFPATWKMSRVLTACAALTLILVLFCCSSPSAHPLCPEQPLPQGAQILFGHTLVTALDKATTSLCQSQHQGEQERARGKAAKQGQNSTAHGKCKFSRAGCREWKLIWRDQVNKYPVLLCLQRSFPTINHERTLQRSL